MADALAKVSQLHSGDVGQGIAKLAEIQRAVETKHEVLVRYPRSSTNNI